MTGEATGIDRDVLEDQGVPRPLTVARTAVARAAEELRGVVDEIAAVERDDEWTGARIREADERAAAAPRALEDPMHRVSEAERRAEYAERLVIETQDVVRAAGEQRAAAEELARMADERSRTAEETARSAAERVAEAERRAAAADLLVTEADARAAAVESRGGAELERQLAEVVGRAEEAVERLEIETARTVELSRRLDEAAVVRRVVEESPDLANIDVRVEASHATAAVDPILAEQMIEALVANAGRRTPPGAASPSASHRRRGREHRGRGRRRARALRAPRGTPRSRPAAPLRSAEGRNRIDPHEPAGRSTADARPSRNAPTAVPRPGFSGRRVAEAAEDRPPREPDRRSRTARSPSSAAE